MGLLNYQGKFYFITYRLKKAKLKTKPLKAELILKTLNPNQAGSRNNLNSLLLNFVQK